MQKDGAIIRARDLETVPMAASRIGVTKQWVYKLIQDNMLDYYDIQGRKLVHRRDTDQIILQRKAR